MKPLSSYVNERDEILLKIIFSKWCCCLCVFLAFGSFLSNESKASTEKTFRISILSVGTVRQNALKGFMEAMTEYEKTDNLKFIYDTKDASGDRQRLPKLADAVVADKPDLIIAAGGVEADTLKKATATTKIPVVFLVVSSSVSRGLAGTLQYPGGNFTGIDTNDTALTGKRLWYIKKIFPEATRVLCFNVPSITPSADSVKIGRKMAPQLGLTLTVIDVDTIADIEAAAKAVTKENTDVIMLNPCAPVSQALKTVLLPLSLQQKIPILGYSEGDISNGALASYGPSRYGIGRQGARIAVKVLNGASPSGIPIEPPENLDLIINRNLVDRLSFSLPTKIWRLANSVVNIEL